jgi:tetratricopeptide (TPR) repeat protein
MLSFLVGLCVFALLLRQCRIQWGRQAILALTLVAMVGMALWLGLTPLVMRFEQLMSEPAALSWAGRMPAFQTAWAISKDFPWLGIGYEAFAVLAHRYRPATEFYINFVYAHNDFLQLLAETGWIGFSLLVGGLFLVVAGIIRRWRKRHDPFVKTIVAAGLTALFVIGLHALVDFNLHVPANALLMITVLALTWSCVCLPHHGEPRADGDAEPIRASGYVKSALAPGLVWLVALGLAMGALRTAVADFFYPQHEIWQTHHWTSRLEGESKRRRLHRALQWKPNHPRYWRSLAALDAQEAWQLLDVNDFIEATQALGIDKLRQAAASYERSLYQHPTEPYTWLAWLHVVQDLTRLYPPSLASHLPDLPTLYVRIASLAPSNPAIQYDLGTLLLRIAPDGIENVTPQQFFQQAIRLEAGYDQKVLQAYRQHLPEAEALRRFVLTVPNTSQGHLRLAKLIEDTHWHQARLHYRTALLLSPSDATLLRAYGMALRHHQAFATAREIWERLREVDPSDATAYVRLAEALRGLEDYEGAAQTLQQLVDRFPMHAEYHVHLARAYAQVGRSLEAEAAWKHVIDLQPHAAMSYAGLAHLYQSNEDLAGAILMMQRAVILAPEHMAYHHVLASLYEQSGNRERAQQMYKRLALRQSQEASVFYKLGQYAQQDGKLLQAISYYRRAVQLKPEHTGFRRALERVVQ